ncbi:hypothetical protein PTW32_14895 [Dechloromonas agitata]|uniref:Uncharacterized protein n=1 Tax=Dechloromonas agitata TaxID=73030 RepID=A0A930BRZ2_9RHOO|nr:hypothetical protein [Dechloromonas agitata]MBF1165023.1 hypothetical protein [Dechloromonas agitata]MDE1546707.1 hypothetical protein [Dechloromonas agitata]
MTDEQIRDSIRLGVPFFGITERGEMMARYLPYGPVFKWSSNQIVPTPLQGSDLLWWLKASDEEDHQE